MSNTVTLVYDVKHLTKKLIDISESQQWLSQKELNEILDNVIMKKFELNYNGY